jgi:uncharacterized protein DUF2752
VSLNRPNQAVIFALRTLGVAFAVVYLGWNVFWLVQARIPPSLFIALTGYPCPTTGGTRAMKCLAAGDWQESLRYNPFAVPMTVLFVLTFGWLVAQLALRKRLSLPSWIVISWAVILPIAWIVKLTGDPAYW